MHSAFDLAFVCEEAVRTRQDLTKKANDRDIQNVRPGGPVAFQRMSAAAVAIVQLEQIGWHHVQQLWTGQAFGRGHVYEHSETGEAFIGLGFVSWAYLAWPLVKLELPTKENVYFAKKTGYEKGARFTYLPWCRCDLIQTCTCLLDRGFMALPSILIVWFLFQDVYVDYFRSFRM